MGSQPTLLDLLQAEFCPPLDSTLVAAIATDYGFDNIKGPESSSDDFQAARAVFARLAAEADKELSDEDALSERFSHVYVSPTSVTGETSSSYDLFSGDNLASSDTATSSTSDASSQHSFRTPLGFLQAAFPHLPSSKLKSALSSYGDAEDMDMESVVEGLLTNEYVRDLEERGLEDDGLPMEFDEQWYTVEVKKKKSDTVPSRNLKRGNKRGTTFTLVDLQQKQHARAPSSDPRMAGADPWTQVSSVASYLSTLLPSYSASHFQSIFHAPEHPTPAKALRAALLSMSRSKATSSFCMEPSPEETNSLFNMLELLSASPNYVALNAEERSQITSDAQLALRATQGQPDTAFDLVWLLRELESDFTSGNLSWGVYHAPAPPSTSSGTPQHSLKGTLKSPTGPPPVQPPPLPASSTRFSPVTPSANAWKTVPQRPPTSRGPHPHAEYIPAYTPASSKRKVRGSGNVIGKGGKGDVGELRGSMARHRGRAIDLMEERRKALREAGRAWQKGNARNHGGEVAFFFAERARKLRQQAREEQLDAAREMVLAKRMSSTNGDTVDLHGTTVTEAVQIVKDLLSEEGASVAKPLRIITGRGKHSANGVGVLGPAVKSALAEDGWVVGTCDGGLVVRGRSVWKM